ncbi:methylmalonyl Co-A mutase-associated GTPase MeaB [uncultured Kriegella sp.]|uniref:methylmalonyl Co-A mutase-associated GTPase MeaB n=1 Tax=uncultured Kriegella sp. TaxID=1798910 RepID=UPI0030D76BFB
MALKKNTYTNNLSKSRHKRKQIPSVEELLNGIKRGDKNALARAITLVESSNADHLEKANLIIEKCLGQNTKTLRVGITGVPGVGKSTFIEVLGKKLTALGKKVAILTVDPTSSESKGSILGDKTRMHELVKDPNAFIRPSPSSESLGGVARKTRETIILCEAAGYDIVLIETVGVGQSETMVHSMVDFFLLLKLAGAGDDLQGIKRGIIEMADALVINKADGENTTVANLAQQDFIKALHLFPLKESGWKPEVLTCSTLENKGIIEVWELIEKFIALTSSNGYFKENRKKQNKNWLLQYIDNRITTDFYRHPDIVNTLPSVIDDVIRGTTSPFTAAEKLFKAYKNQKK